MNFRRVRLLIWKEFLQLRRDRAMLPIVFIMPALQLLMFGYVVGADVRNLPTAVVDLDGTQLSRQVATSFSSSGYFRIVARPPSEAGIRPLMDGNKVQVAIVVPAGFSRTVQQRQNAPILVVVDGSDSKTASIAQGYATAILANLNNQLQPGANSVRGSPAARFSAIDARIRVLFNPSLRAVNTMVPGLIALILLLSMTALMSQAVVKERERGTLEQLFVTPIQRSEYLLGKITPYVMVAIVQITVIVTVGLLWFHVPFRGSALVVGLGLLLFMIMAIGQALLISMISKTRFQAQQAVVLIMIPSMMLSGFIFPIESMPQSVQLISYVIPLRYVLVVMRSSFMKGSGFLALGPQFIAMAAFSAAIFGFAITRFHKKLSD